MINIEKLISFFFAFAFNLMNVDIQSLDIDERNNENIAITEHEIIKPSRTKP